LDELGVLLDMLDEAFLVFGLFEKVRFLVFLVQWIAGGILVIPAVGSRGTQQGEKWPTHTNASKQSIQDNGKNREDESMW
jgi:hypothetical protein